MSVSTRVYVGLTLDHVDARGSLTWGARTGGCAVSAGWRARLASRSARSVLRRRRGADPGERRPGHRLPVLRARPGRGRPARRALRRVGMPLAGIREVLA